MINLAEKPDTELTVSRLDVSMRGSVIVAGQVKQADALKAAADLPVRGLIIGSLFPSLLSVREMRYPIILTDSFGVLPMNSAAYRLISTNAKREVTLNAEFFDRYSGARPEVIILCRLRRSRPSRMMWRSLLPANRCGCAASLLRGSSVRLWFCSRACRYFRAACRAAAAEVRLENGEQLLIPLVNLEVVG